MAYVFTVEMDRIWFKYRSGFYGYLGKKAVARWQKDGVSPILGTLSENLESVGSAYQELQQTHKSVTNDLYKATEQGRRAYHRTVGGVYHTLFGNWSIWDEWSIRIPQKIPADILTRRFGIFEDATFQRSEKQLPSNEPGIFHYMGSLRNLRIDPEVYDLMALPFAKWTPEIEHNHNVFKRLYYRLLNLVAPHYMTAEHHERFVLGGNCRLMDGIVDEATMIVDYCLNNWAYNLPNATYNTTYQNATARYVIESSKHRRGTISNKYGDRATWQPHLGSNRLRLNHVEETKHKYVRPRVLMFTNGNFNLVEWFVSLIQDIVGVDANQSVDDFFDNLRGWFTNPNTDIMDYPNVGAAYWIQFAFICKFPDNVGCIVGTGIELAIRNVTIAYALVIIVLFATGLGSLLTFIASIFVYLIAILVVAYHWTPICLLPFPAFTMGFGISIPFLPIPIGFWALPMCLWDDLWNLLTKYFVQCLDFIIPAALVNGAVCPDPSMPMRIDIANCLDVGIGDGLSNLLYWMYTLFGETFCDVILAISQTTVGQLWPGLNAYLTTTLNAFKTAAMEGGDQAERLRICAIITSGSIAFPLVFFVVIAAVLLFIIPAIYGIITALLGLFAQTNVYESLVTAGEPTEFDVIAGEDDQIEPEYEDNDDESIAGRIARGITGMLTGRPKLKRE